jgi:hypothetical protein
MAKLKSIPKFKPLAEASAGTKKTVQVVLGAVLLMLLAALGLEGTNNDWDLGKLLSGSTPEEAKILRDENGNFLLESCKSDIYNCEDFQFQEDAQEVKDKCGGAGYDINRLDGDKDGVACEALPKKQL